MMSSIASKQSDLRGSFELGEDGSEEERRGNKMHTTRLYEYRLKVEWETIGLLEVKILSPNHQQGISKHSPDQVFNVASTSTGRLVKIAVKVH